MNNHKDCDFDGGDCCGENVKKSYCNICECLDPYYKCEFPQNQGTMSLKHGGKSAAMIKKNQWLF